MAVKATTTGHVGTKTIGLLMGLVLGFLWLLFNMFFVWLPAMSTSEGVTLLMVGNALGIFVVLVFAIPLLIFLVQIMWVWIHVVGEKIGANTA